MRNELLVELVNKVLKQKGKVRPRGNLAYICPFHSQKVPSEKLEINFDESSKHYQNWGCWVCGKDARGRKLYSLFKRLGATKEHILQLRSITQDKSYYKEDLDKKPTNLELPKEFIPLTTYSSSLTYRKAINFLKKRGIGKREILLYNIGYCEWGKYQDRIIIPSYDKRGELNYFITRTFLDSSFEKYKFPPASRDIIPFELFINFNLPIILCEGVFDAITIKRNAIPLLGTVIQDNLMKKIVLSKVEKIYIALDPDAIKKSLNIVEYLIDQGKKVYLIDLKEKDPNEMGFEEFTKLTQSTPLTTRHVLMARKLSLI